MKNLRLTAVLISATALLSTENPAITRVSQNTSLEMPDVSPKTELLADGGNKFGGRKAQRKRNRRTKRMNRKFGVGFLPTGSEVNHV